MAGSKKFEEGEHISSLSDFSHTHPPQSDRVENCITTRRQDNTLRRHLPTHLKILAPEAKAEENTAAATPPQETLTSAGPIERNRPHHYAKPPRAETFCHMRREDNLDKTPTTEENDRLKHGSNEPSRRGPLTAPDEAGHRRGKRETRSEGLSRESF
ncbi:hypothetical protein ISN44_As08g020350 [Arabidopsis suecica]|uniref:Uncharacterized protein n=1 Tax=Arabidopsis suecica TaxID=45249 RepID=A0A8T2B5B3_ARASU|nr:hypothetical protein ISN44_As08g020350 [Arabidopsis suecica]